MCIFDVETNHPSYKLSKTYIKEEDTLLDDTCQLNRSPLNFDGNHQEYVPIESVRHLLIDEIANAQHENTGYCTPAEGEVPDFHELGVDIERQFHELNALNDAIFIDG